ncbi:hypothetical protein [Pseudomonas shirazensis]
MKRFFINLFVLIFIMVGCKNKIEDKKEVSVLESSEYQNTEGIKSNLTCDEALNEIIKSSNLDFKNYLNYFISIDEIKDNFIKAHIYTQNNLSNNPKNLKIVQTTIAMILFDPIRSKLYDATVSAEKPIELNFDRNIAIENNVFDCCKITSKHENASQESLIKSFMYTSSNEDYDKSVNPTYSNKEKDNRLYSLKEDVDNVKEKNTHSNNYGYLLKVNHNQIIQHKAGSKNDYYDVILVRGNKIISNLEIDLKDKDSTNQLYITKDYILNLFKEKNDMQKDDKWKSYRINKKGIIEELQ